MSPRPVRVLEDRVINQIAAGEVVERPASVLKELFENALDAGATTVEVTLRDGGKDLVRVADNGHGMTREDAMMCLERHATSKIRETDDLLSVATLGFRGEALPSIASVSQFVLTTRVASEEVGTRIIVDGGVLGAVRDAGCPVGTQIDVKKIFGNVPARRKFLRTTQTEHSHCVEAVIREILIRPQVDVTVRHNGRESLRAPRVSEWKDRVEDVLGTLSFRRIEGGGEGITVSGLVAPPSEHRGTATAAQYLYVNGRYVRDAVVRRGVTEAYRELVPKGRYPVVVLDVRIDPAQVDVNVHPAKIEVRFRRPSEVVHVVAETLRGALATTGTRTRPEPRRPDSLPLGRSGPLFVQEPAPEPQRLSPLPPPEMKERAPAPPPTWQEGVRAPVPRSLDVPRPREAAQVESLPSGPSPEVGHAAHAPSPAPVPEPKIVPPAVATAAPLGPPLRLVGTVGPWLLLEESDQIVFLDRRAAEGALQERRLAEDGPGVMKRLLTPALVVLGRAEVATLDLAGLEGWIAAEPLGHDGIAVRACCEAVRGLSLEEILRAVGAGSSITAAVAAAMPLSLSPETLVASLREAGLSPRAFVLPLDAVERLQKW